MSSTGGSANLDSRVTPVLFLECLLWFNCIIIPVEKDDEIEKYRGTNRKLTRMELEQISNNLE